MATSHQDGFDPAGAQTPEAFMQMLREVRAASGLSLVEVAERARERGYDLDPVGLNRDLDAPTLPSWQTVTGVLTACGLGGMQIDRWIRVYHDLAAPAQRLAFAEAATAVQAPIDVEPVSVPPLVLTTVSATPARLDRRHFAIAAGVLAALIVTPLLLFVRFGGEPGTAAVQATSTAPRTIPVPAPAFSDEPVAQPSPTGTAAPTTPAPVRTSVKPPARTTEPPPPPPPPPPSPRPSPTPAPPSPPGPIVLRSGVAALTGNGGFDLDSGQSGGESDIERVNDDTLRRRNGSLLEPMSRMPGKQDCEAEQGWETSVGGLQPGQWLCVKTSDGRYGRLNITAVGATLKLAYTIWA